MALYVDRILMMFYLLSFVPGLFDSTVVVFFFCLRFENHCGRFDPVGEENGGRHDSDRLRSLCFCPCWPSTVHGKSASKMRAMARRNE